jgi:hypothetical protein
MRPASREGRGVEINRQGSYFLGAGTLAAPLGAGLIPLRCTPLGFSFLISEEVYSLTSWSS